MCPQDTRTIYATVVDMEDHLEHVDGFQFDVKDFINHPETYRSTFYEKVPVYVVVCYLIRWCRYFPTLPVWSIASTGHLALPGFLLWNNVSSYKQGSWMHRLQELHLFLSVFWLSVTFQPTLMYAMFILYWRHSCDLGFDWVHVTIYIHWFPICTVQCSYWGISLKHVSHTICTTTCSCILSMQHVWSWNCDLVHWQHASAAATWIHWPFWSQAASIH